ncbi:hypothetical protein [Streptomyces sp. CB02923]|uniref:hypothetical protein n=1 Tax=Streptomyces sp. CB02923 TaxID=1718985 RepID=UPI001902178D|nr:hypothetical protein [Streptomyces sp. CB02923]
MTPRQQQKKPPTPFLELRIGGVHVVVQHMPYRLLAVLSSVAGAAGGAFWVGGR